MTKHPFKYLSFLSMSLCLIAALPYADPTRPPIVSNLPTTGNASTSTNVTNLLLTAIFIYPAKSVAIINGTPLTIGEKVGEYTITRIEVNTVELEGPQNAKQTLTLYSAVKSSSE